MASFQYCDQNEGLFQYLSLSSRLYFSIANRVKAYLNIGDQDELPFYASKRLVKPRGYAFNQKI
ncbi:MAG: hypothetical protein CL599_04100 [Alteromonas sp.]|nr:hypothetical protein [Alteromonas sp.]OUX90648.1 MAG: hypothetical protein CBB95_04090 [Alteromonas sp. TMED35]